MDRLAYTALSGLRAAMSRQNVTASNLANASTPGFRAEMSAARTAWLTGADSHHTRAMADQEVLSADMASGPVNSTGRDLDVAIGGDGLLAVQADNGDEAYTRRGDLVVSDTGLVTTGDGRPVMGEGGPLTLPPFDKVIIAGDGQVSIIPAGGDATQPQLVDRLKVVSPTGSQIAKGLDGLFRVIGGGTLPSDPEASVTAGALEGSNVNSSQALVDMIDASRAWETQVKLVTSVRDLDTDATRLMQLD
jgi:flagellar basal-body rod protein FlgF